MAHFEPSDSPAPLTHWPRCPDCRDRGGLMVDLVDPTRQADKLRDAHGDFLPGYSREYVMRYPLECPECLWGRPGDDSEPGDFHDGERVRIIDHRGNVPSVDPMTPLHGQCGILRAFGCVKEQTGWFVELDTPVPDMCGDKWYVVIVPAYSLERELRAG